MAIAHCPNCQKIGKPHPQDQLHGDKFLRTINEFPRKGAKVERCTVCGHEKVLNAPK